MGSLTQTHRILFSIVVPVYNVEQYLERCVGSLLRQEYQRFEVILVDDGSTDISGVMCDIYAELDTRIAVVHQQNKGLSAARNAGMGLAKGDYVVFVDADDWLQPWALSSIANASALTRARSGGRNPDTVATFPLPRSSRETKQVEALSKSFEVGTGAEFWAQAINCGIYPLAAWRYASRLGFLREAKLVFKEGILYEDLEFTPRLLSAAEVVVFNRCSYYAYEQRAGSITTDSENNVKAWHDVVSTCRELRGYLDGYDAVLARAYLMVFRKLPLEYTKPSKRDKDFVLACLSSSPSVRDRLQAVAFAGSPALYKHVANFLRIRHDKFSSGLLEAFRALVVRK